MVTGYIVVNTDGKCLDRNLHWRDRQALREAFVHQQNVVVSGGSWASVAQVVYPAEFDPAVDWTKVTGEAVSFTKFVASVVMAEAAVK